MTNRIRYTHLFLGHLFSVSFLAVHILPNDLLVADEGHLNVVLSDAEVAVRDQERYINWQHAVHTLNDSELRQLLLHKSDMVAVAAAWELHVVRQGQPDEHKEPHITDIGAAAFSAFLEGRLRIALPKWYRHSLCNGIIRGDYLSLHEFDSKKYTKLVGEDVFTSAGECVSLVADDVVLKGASGELAFPLVKLHETQGYGPIGISFASVGDLFWVGRHPDRLEPYPLTCFDRGLRKWSSEVWTALRIPMDGGTGFYHLSVVRCTAESVYVVGVGLSGTYVEGFDSAKGSVQMRFLSTIHSGSRFEAVE